MEGYNNHVITLFFNVDYAEREKGYRFLLFVESVIGENLTLKFIETFINSNLY